MNTENTQALKDAIIAEVARDVLLIKDEVTELRSLVTQLKESLPALFDLLKAGTIETLEEINKGILEAGGERIDYVRGQLSVFLEQALTNGLDGHSKRINGVIEQLEKQSNVAARNLRNHYDEVAAGMEAVRDRQQKSSISTGLKVTIAAVTLAMVICSGVVCYQVASYKEAVYMKAFMSELPTSKHITPRSGTRSTK